MGEAPVRHVWVNVDGQAMPGLLVAWRRGTAGDWEALVVYLVGEDRAITAYVSSTVVRPARVRRLGPGFAAYGQVFERSD
jgi:hypothetical protein